LQRGENNVLQKCKNRKEVLYCRNVKVKCFTEGRSDTLV
jgi:hypothetical protein